MQCLNTFTTKLQGRIKHGNVNWALSYSPCYNNNPQRVPLPPILCNILYFYLHFQSILELDIFWSFSSNGSLLSCPTLYPNYSSISRHHPIQNIRLSLFGSPSERLLRSWGEGAHWALNGATMGSPCSRHPSCALSAHCAPCTKVPPPGSPCSHIMEAHLTSITWSAPNLQNWTLAIATRAPVGTVGPKELPCFFFSGNIT